MNGGESIYVRYRCGNKLRRHSCAHLTEHIVEEYMISHIRENLEQEIAEIALKSRRPHSRTESEAGAAREAARRELERLNLLFQKGRITEQYYDRQCEILDARLVKYQDPENCTSMESYSIPIKTFRGSWRELYLQLDKAHRQTFWKSIISSIEIDQETRRICGFSFLKNLAQ